MLETIPNQPVVFDAEEVACKSNDFLYVQPVNVGDVTSFQVAISPCVPTPVNDDPGFDDSGEWTQGSGWSVVNSQACKTGGWFSSLSQPGVLVVGKYYKIVVEIDSYSGAVFVGDSATNFGQIYQTGENVFYGFATTTALNVLAGLSGTVCMDSMKVFEMPSRLLISVNDTEGNVAYSINPDDDPEYFAFSGDRVTTFIDWDSFAITGTCYYICLTEPCTSTNGQNGLFNEDFRLKGTGWGWTNDVIKQMSANTRALVFTSSGIGTLSATNDVTVLKSGISYDVTYTIVSVTNTTVFPRIGTQTGTSRATAGTYTDTIVGDGTSFEMVCTAGAGGGDATIDTIELSLTDEDDIECDFTSNNFKYGNNACTLLIQACSDVNALNFNFSSFTPSIRVSAKLCKAQYPSDRTVVTNNNGVKRVAYFIGRKNKEIRMSPHPEYIHDFLRTLPGYNQVFIDGIEHVISDDEYEVNYEDEAEDFGTSTLIVEIKEQLVTFIGCGDDETGQCSISEQFISLDDDPEVAILTETGLQILLES